MFQFWKFTKDFLDVGMQSIDFIMRVQWSTVLQSQQSVLLLSVSERCLDQPVRDLYLVRGHASDATRAYNFAPAINLKLRNI